MKSVLADLLVSLGSEKGLKVSGVGELDLAEPACQREEGGGKEPNPSVRTVLFRARDYLAELTGALGLLVEKSGLVVELLVDSLDGTRDRGVDVGSGLDLRV